MRKNDAVALQDDCSALIAAAMGQIPDDAQLYVELTLIMKGLFI